MYHKSLLSEAQVRRFMGLAGMKAVNAPASLSEDWGEHADQDRRHDVGGVEKKAGVVDGHFKDYMKEEDDAAELEDDAADDMEDAVGDEADAEMNMADAEADVEMADTAEADVGEDAIQAAVNALADLEALVQPLADAAGISAPDAEADMDAPIDMDAPMDMGDELPDEAAEDELDGAELDMGDEMADEEEVVMEVAKRVARRILQARKAQKMLDEALGNK